MPSRPLTLKSILETPFHTSLLMFTPYLDSFPCTKQQDLFFPWEKDEEPYGPSLPSELNVWSIMDTDWKNTLCSTEQVHWMGEVRLNHLASALFAVRRCWHTVFSRVPCCSPSGKYFSLILSSFSETTSSPETFSSSSISPWQKCSPWTLEKQAH